MSIRNVGIIGSGTMGNGIAHVFAQSGYEVILMDIQQAFLEKGIATITKNLDRQVKKEKISEADKTATLQRLKTSTDLGELKDCDFVVEAATENRDIKFKLFKDLDDILKPGVILSSNTSSISITEIAAQTSSPERVIGMHFMNPVPVMKLFPQPWNSVKHWEKLLSKPMTIPAS